MITEWASTIFKDESWLGWFGQTHLALILLIVIILWIRRPVARHFGASAAYALWALPVLRFLLPNLPFRPYRPEALMQENRRITSPGDAVLSDIHSPYQLWVDNVQPVTVHWDLAHLCIYIWGGGAVLWLIYQTLAYVNYRQRVIARSRIVGSDIHQMAEHIAARMQACSDRSWLETIGLKKYFRKTPIMPQIILSQDATGPLVVGLLRPIIILPHDFQTRFSLDQQCLALTHEMAHIKRRDLWAILAFTLFQAVNWLNPLVHMARHAFRSDLEAACDQYVLHLYKSKTDIVQNYARTLVRAVRLSEPSERTRLAYKGPITAAMPLSLTIHHPLKERLLLMKKPDNLPGRTGHLFLCGVLALLLLITAPITRAEAPGESDDRLAGAADKSMRDHDKKIVTYIVDNNDGQEHRHYELEEENGVVSAWRIDGDGSRTRINPDELMEMRLMDKEGHRLRDIAKQRRDEIHRSRPHDSKSHKVVIKKTMKMDDDADKENARIFIHKMDHKNLGKAYGFAFADMDDAMDINIDIDIDMDHGDQAAIINGTMASVALDMIDNMDEKSLSRSTQRKLQNARDALKALEAALEAESQ